jgi:glycosyltransferase involved in cell wall biosynthesis
MAARLGLPTKPTVLYAGRLDADKCMDVWLRAVPRVLRQVDAHFIVGGNGNERGRLERLAVDLGVADAVTFTGFLGDAEYPRLFSLADVFAITSPAELQSVVTLEAAASGLPIVAARAGALPELVEDGVNGWLTVPGDPRSFADAIVDVLTRPTVRQSMRQASRDVAQKHDLDATISQYEDVYRGVIGSGGFLGRAVAGSPRPRPVSA